MPSFSLASSRIGRFLASCAIWMSVFGLVCCDAGIERFLLKEHLTLRSRAKRGVSKGRDQSCCCPSFETLRDAALLRMRFSQTKRAPTARFAAFAHSPAPTFGPSLG